MGFTVEGKGAFFHLTMMAGKAPLPAIAGTRCGAYHDASAVSSVFLAEFDR
ncbi:MAG TPA: hypothetical protein VFV55_04690 [Usitatibacteraceae bacterium]|nr:hypothetical protein [Usitatibacteraceae bacterium]